MNLPTLFIALCLGAMFLSAIWFGVTVCQSPGVTNEFDLAEVQRRKVSSSLRIWKTDGVTKLVYIDDGSRHKGLARLIWEKDGFALAELPDGTEYVLLRGEYSHTIYPIKQEPKTEEQPRVKVKAIQRSVQRQVEEVCNLVQEILHDDTAREVHWTQQAAPQPTNPLYVCPVQGCKSQWDWSLAQCSGCGATLAWILKMQSEGASGGYISETVRRPTPSSGELLERRPSMNKVIKEAK